MRRTRALQEFGSYVLQGRRSSNSSVWHNEEGSSLHHMPYTSK